MVATFKETKDQFQFAIKDEKPNEVLFFSDTGNEWLIINKRPEYMKLYKRIKEFSDNQKEKNLPKNLENDLYQYLWEFEKMDKKNGDGEIDSKEPENKLSFWAELKIRKISLDGENITIIYEIIDGIEYLDGSGYVDAEDDEIKHIEKIAIVKKEKDTFKIITLQEKKEWIENNKG